MALSRYLMAACLYSAPLVAAFPTEVSGQMFYLLHRGETGQAFEAYLNYSQENQEQDFPLLQQAGIRLLEQGISSSDAETQLMCMFGAGVANTPELLPVLEKGIRSHDQRTQLIALSYLSRQEDDCADTLLLGALSSPSLLTRLEACYQLALKNHPAVLSHLQSLIVKIPDLARALFPQIIIHLEGGQAQNYLKQFLTDPHVEVRVEAILAIAKEERDDFLPQIRSLASQVHHAQQECCAFALGKLKDTRSIPLLKELSQSQRIEVKLASAIALYELGETNYLELIEKEAKEGNLFAISSLGKLSEGKDILNNFLLHPDRDIRLNATLSLLEQNENASLKEILLPGRSDIGFMRAFSPGRALKAWKTVPSHHYNTKGYSGLVQQTIGLREKVLTQAIELPEKEFLDIACYLMQEKQSELIPLLVMLLENKRSPDAIALLKDGHQKAGEPLIRNYCTLALYRLKEEGPYEKQLLEWVEKAADRNLIQFREEESSSNLFSSRHELTPEEESRFLVETFETLAQSQNQTGVEALVKAIAYGNPKNRYALAGLLIRTAE